MVKELISTLRADASASLMPITVATLTEVVAPEATAWLEPLTVKLPARSDQLGVSWLACAPWPKSLLNGND